MAEWDGEFSFFQEIHVRTDLRIHILVSIRPMTTKFKKQVYLGELTQTRLIKQVMVMLSRRDRVTN